MPPTPFTPDPTAVVRLPSREEVRAAVAAHAADLRAAADRGENVHQIGLDGMDKVRAYAAALQHAQGDDAAAAFLEMWNEETAASTAHTLAEADRLDAETAQILERQAGQDHAAYVVGGIVAAILLALVFWMIIAN